MKKLLCLFLLGCLFAGVGCNSGHNDADPGTQQAVPAAKSSGSNAAAAKDDPKAKVEITKDLINSQMKTIGWNDVVSYPELLDSDGFIVDEVGEEVFKHTFFMLTSVENDDMLYGIVDSSNGSFYEVYSITNGRYHLQSKGNITDAKEN